LCESSGIAHGGQTFFAPPKFFPGRVAVAGPEIVDGRLFILGQRDGVEVQENQILEEAQAGGTDAAKRLIGAVLQAELGDVREPQIEHAIGTLNADFEAEAIAAVGDAAAA
jgi:hypothetical protein